MPATRPCSATKPQPKATESCFRTPQGVRRASCIRRCDGTIVVSAPSAQTRKIFEITQLNRAIPLYETADLAVAAIETATSGP